MYVYVTMINTMIFIILFIYLEYIKQVTLETILSLHRKVGDPCSNVFALKIIRIYADIVQNHTLPEVFPNFWRAVYANPIRLKSQLHQFNIFKVRSKIT